MSWQTIRSYRSRDSADHAALLLNGCGIKTLINGDDAGGMRPDFALFFGVNLLVHESQAEEAKAILVDSEKSQVAIDSRATSPVAGPTNTRLGLTKFLMRSAWIMTIAGAVFYNGRAQIAGDGPDGVIVLFILSMISGLLTMEYLRQKTKVHRALIWKLEESEQNTSR